MLAAVLTVSGPWLPARWRHWWWGLLLAFVPIHLVVSAVVPARSLLGLSVGYFVGALVVLVVGTPALEVPLDGAAWALGRRGFVAETLAVVRPAGHGPLELCATDAAGQRAVVELYGPNQRSGGALRQIRRWLVLRDKEVGPLQPSMHRAVEHRALMTIAVGDLGLANTRTLAVAELERGWTVFAHSEPRGVTIDQVPDDGLPARIWQSLAVLQRNQISHGDMRLGEITVDDGRALGRRNQVINALIVRGMLCLQRETGSCRKFTKITDKGREVLSVILADRADTLQREQFPEFDPNGKRWHGGRGKRLPADAESV